MAGIEPLRRFVCDLSRWVEQIHDEAALIDAVRPGLAHLIADDDWLPAACAQPHPVYYRQYLLHCDPLERFSVVSFVWGPGQRTPVHDHTVWGLVGILRGAELCQPYVPDLQGWMQPHGPPHTLQRGDIEAVSPRLGDVHSVANALPDRLSISVHVYGGNIGAVRRHVYLEPGAHNHAQGSGARGDAQVSTASPRVRPFISGYSSATMPNLWDRSLGVLEGSGARGAP